MKHIQTELKGKIDNSTIVVGDFNTPLSIMGRITRQKISKDIENLYNTINQADMTNIRTTLPLITREYVFFSSVHGTYFRIEDMLSYKTSVNQPLQ